MGTRGGRPEPIQAGAKSPQPNARQARPRPAQTGPRPAAQSRPRAAAPAGSAAPDAAEPALSRGQWLKRHWLEVATWALSLAGLGVSIYLTIAHFTTPAILACSDKGFINCAGVTTSAESKLFGIPVAVLGLVFYVFMAAVNSPWGWRMKRPWLGWARLGSVVVGMIFVLYLIYTELYTLNAICLWCTSVHVITFLLFGLIVFASAAGYGAPQQADGKA